MLCIHIWKLCYQGLYIRRVLWEWKLVSTQEAQGLIGLIPRIILFLIKYHNLKGKYFEEEGVLSQENTIRNMNNIILIWVKLSKTTALNGGTEKLVWNRWYYQMPVMVRKMLQLMRRKSFIIQQFRPFN